MATLIEIEGAVARLVDRTVVAEVPVDALQDRLTTTKERVSPILPRGTIADYIASNEIWLMIEREPRIETIRVELKDLDGDSVTEYARENGFDWPEDLNGTYRLPVPWEYWEFTGELTPINLNGEQHFRLSQANLFWSDKRITQLKATLYHPILPNIREGEVCWGSTSTGGGSLAEKIETQINMFYRTPFNEDWGHLNFPVPLADLDDVTIDEITKIPSYSWRDFSTHQWDWADSLGLARPNIQATLTPPDWNITDIIAWYRGLSQVRRRFIDGLATMDHPNTAATPSVLAVPAA